MDRTSGNPFLAREGHETLPQVRSGLGHVAEVGSECPHPGGRHSSGCPIRRASRGSPVAIEWLWYERSNITRDGKRHVRSNQGRLPRPRADGAPMAERLLAPDVSLHLCDSRPEAMAPFAERGAIACASPAASFVWTHPSAAVRLAHGQAPWRCSQRVTRRLSPRSGRSSFASARRSSSWASGRGRRR
jgi:hypothetical protein